MEQCQRSVSLQMSRMTISIDLNIFFSCFTPGAGFIKFSPKPPAMLTTTYTILH